MAAVSKQTLQCMKTEHLLQMVNSCLGMSTLLCSPSQDLQGPLGHRQCNAAAAEAPAAGSVIVSCGVAVFLFGSTAHGMTQAKVIPRTCTSVDCTRRHRVV